MSQSYGVLAFKSGIWYTISNFLLKSIGFITTPFFTRILSLEEYGQFNNYTSWSSIMTIIVSIDLSATLISAKYDFTERFDSYILSMGTLEAISSCIWLILVNVFRLFFTRFFDMDLIYINFMLVYIFFSSIFSLFQNRERFLYKYKTNAILCVFNAVVSTLLSVVLVLSCEDRLLGRIMGMVVPMVLIGIILCFFIIKKGKMIDWHSWKYAITICLPYVPHALSLILLTSMDRIMINKICGPEETALYGLAYTCGAVLTFLISSLNGAFAPWLGDQLHEKKIKNIRKISYFYICIFLYSAIGIMLITPEILLIMGGEQYLSARFVLAPVSLGVSFQFLYTMYVNIEQYQKKTTGMALATVIAAGTNYILNIILIPIFGYVAAAYTTAISYLCLLLLHMLIVHIIGMGDVYSSRFMLYSAVLMSLFTIVVNIIYQHVLIRVLLISVYLVVAIVIILRNKKNILGLFKKLGYGNKNTQQ